MPLSYYARKLLTIANLLYVPALDGTININSGFGNQNDPLVEELNLELKQRKGCGKFASKQGRIIYEGGRTSPMWAINRELERIGYKSGFGSLGVDPFHVYPSLDEFDDLTSLTYYANKFEFVWHRDAKIEFPCTGSDILEDNITTLGSDFFEKARKIRDRNSKWANYAQSIIPMILGALTWKFWTALGIASGGVTALWVTGASALYYIKRLLSSRRPVILSNKDTNIYGSIFSRLFWKYPSLPRVIINEDLEGDYNSLVSKTKRVVDLKKNGLNRSFTHAIFHGPPGTGKTLAAKSLAATCNMNFIYLTLEDISQLPEEEALSTFKSYLEYVSGIKNTLFIIDEADRLCSKKDLKSQKLKIIFQRMVSKSSSKDYKIILITNYPERLDEEIISRASTFYFFDKPSFSKQKELFREHLKIAVETITNSEIEVLVNSLKEGKIEGMTGRDIESICQNFALETIKDDITLNSLISRFKKQRAQLRQKSNDRDDHTKPKPITQRTKLHLR